MSTRYRFTNRLARAAATTAGLLALAALLLIAAPGVKAQDAAGAAMATVWDAAAAPATPQNFNASSNHNVVDLTWEHGIGDGATVLCLPDCTLHSNAGQPTSHVVERRQSTESYLGASIKGGPVWEEIAGPNDNDPGAEPGYTDTIKVQRTSQGSDMPRYVEYRVKAVNSNGSSSYADPIRVYLTPNDLTTKARPPAIPADFQLNGEHLEWLPAVGDIHHYKVETRQLVSVDADGNLVAGTDWTSLGVALNPAGRPPASYYYVGPPPAAAGETAYRIRACNSDSVCSPWVITN